MGHGLKIEFLKIEFKCWKIKCVEFHGGYDALIRNMPTPKYDNDQWERNDVKHRQAQRDRFKSWALAEDSDGELWWHKEGYEYFWVKAGQYRGCEPRKLDFN